MSKSILCLLAATLALVPAISVLAVPPPLQGACLTRNFTTVDIDLEQFQGAWYEIAYSKSFYWGRDCTCTTAEYSLLPTGKLRVMNMCRKKDVKAGIYQREARGRLVGPGQLKINFFAGFPLADADYQVVWIDQEHYNEAVIVSCSNIGGNLAWIISRRPTMDKARFEKHRKFLVDQGFVVDDLTRTEQQGCWSFDGEKSPVIRREEQQVSSAVPKACALPTTVTSFPYEELTARWHILYTQPDFVENIFSRNCLCNTVTLEPSSGISEGYAGTWRASVVCRGNQPDGKRSDFVRPVYQISNLTSLLGHFTQKLYGGIANEHWQVIAHAPDYEHMLLYTCLDTKLSGPTYCLHIVGRQRQVAQSVVDEYVELAKKMGLYKADKMRSVFHGDGCVYDPMPYGLKNSPSTPALLLNNGV